MISIMILVEHKLKAKLKFEIIIMLYQLSLLVLYVLTHFSEVLLFMYSAHSSMSEEHMSPSMSISLSRSS
jgi:hypothetical protein